jgi:uncharacterized protein (TIGR03435 family)
MKTTAAALLVVATIALPACLPAQSTTTACPATGISLAAYDVISVKLAHPERLLLIGARDTPDGISGDTVPVVVLIQQAAGNWSVPEDDAISGLPDWAKSDFYSVNAKMSPEQVAAFKDLNKDQQQACPRDMLLALLADRFHLRLHHQTRQVIAYELLVAKGGSRLQETTGPDPNAPSGANGKPITGSYMSMSIKNGAQEVTMHGYSMDQLARFLTRDPAVSHTVVDKTSLTGKYSFTLTFAATRGVGAAYAPGEAAALDPAPTIFNVLEDQLGLHLQKGTANVDTVVVDHIERPAAN